MGTYEPCVLGSDGNCTRWSHDHAADRPSVTDNARDEEPLAWCPGCGDRIPTEVIRERGVCSNCYGTSDDPWATDRTEAWDKGYLTGYQDRRKERDYNPGQNPYRATGRAENAYIDQSTDTAKEN